MSLLSREECIELGVSIPTGPLIGWVTEQLGAVKGRSERLATRGITTSFLGEVKALVGRVAQLQISLGIEEESLPPEVAHAQRIREQASAYLQEVKQIVKIEFGTCPEIQVQFRPGVRTGRLLANLCREMECVVAVLREHTEQLGWLGVDEDFIKVGAVVIGRLKEASVKLDSACKALPPDLTEQCFEKGKLYDLTRKLVRIGKLEFLREPEQAAAFNYSRLRKELRTGSEVRAVPVKTAAK